MDITANWIWLGSVPAKGYNTHVVFRKDFRLETLPQQAHLAVTADTKYRLKINGQWCADGPARAYPDHYSYDVIDASALLRTGLNRIECEVRFFGCGTFKQLPQRGGFLCQLTADDNTLVISDDTWEAAEIPQWVKNTLKSCPQMGPWEMFDASAAAPFVWEKATVVCGAQDGPWKNLYQRETPMLTREELLLKKVISCRAVAKEYDTIGIYPNKMVFPEAFVVNNQDVSPMILAAEVTSPRDQEISIKYINMVCSVNGKTADDNGLFKINAGKNLIICAMRVLCGHDANSIAALDKSYGIKIENIHCKIFDELCALTMDIPLYPWANQEFQGREKKYEVLREAVFKFKTIEEFTSAYPESKQLTQDELIECAGAISTLYASYPDMSVKVDDPQNIVYPDDRDTVIYPADGCDVELLCDLGTQSVGYWNFMLNAAAGTVVDIAGFEYITPTGVLQQPGERYNNSMRYICKDGFNRFTSYQRRGGRYITITLRNITSPVRFRSFRMVESTYPTVFTGDFHSSDSRLDKVYEISKRTLKLCMEDTFTDCPLYEQTFWVGDSRNEAIFAMNSCGAYDLVRRCVRLTAESLNHLPLIGCQVPSSWSCHIPSFGYLWTLAVEDYYMETADIDFLKELFPKVEELMARSLKLCDNPAGLLRTMDWNFLDWSNTDTQHPYLIYNTIMLTGGLRCASRLAGILGDENKCRKYDDEAAKLTGVLSKYWNERHQAFTEAMDDDGKCSDVYSIHTSLLALLFDATDENNISSVRANLLGGRSDLLPVGSPFFTYYLHAAYEKLGAWEQSYSKAKKDYFEILDFGATTVWETFALASYDHTHTSTDDFPTRSHCHAWSSIPLEMFPRLILGIRRSAPGCSAFTISPYPGDLKYANGSRVTPHGTVNVSWKLNREAGKLFITCRHPRQVECNFVSNICIDEFDVEYQDVII